MARRVPGGRRPRLLELFSGTHSIGKVADELGFDVVSLDRDLGAECPFGTGFVAPKHIRADIMDWDYRQFPRGYFHVVTASPVCRVWSQLRDSWIGRRLRGMTREFSKADIRRDIEEEGQPMVDRLLEIMAYFRPNFWWIENPKMSRMKFYLKDLPHHDVDYCMYSDWGYRKGTRFWTNIPNFEPKTCDGKGTCGNMTVSDRGRPKHKATVDGGGKRDGTLATGCKQFCERYKMPPDLIRDLLLPTLPEGHRPSTRARRNSNRKKRKSRRRKSNK